MGASHATLSSASEDATAVLKKDEFAIEERLYPGSGRMMRSFRAQRANGSLAVAKCMWTSPDDAEEIKKQQEELARIKEALRGQPHVAPFDYWNAGPAVPTTGFRPVALVRDHVYTTLSARLESRPFLKNVEKLYMIHQLLSALQRMHDSNVLHGFLTTENIGLTSWNHVVILDIASYKARTSLPDDDPSEYLYYFQEFHSNQDTNTQLRCYLAPERFYSPKSGDPPAMSLTPAMDVFSTGCVILEMWLNGERALDLGDLMDYRKGEGLLPQKLQKIESSSLRAACRHMLSLEPEKRLTPREYLERLQDIMPSYEVLDPLMERLTQHPPDARMAIAAAHYPKLLEAATGKRDEQGEAYFAAMIGPTMCRLEKLVEDYNEKSMEEPGKNENQMLQETEALLKKLADLDLDEEKEVSNGGPPPIKIISTNDEPLKSSTSSLLIFVQLILANLRHVNRPSSKLVALQLLQSLTRVSSDETRLQRMLPSTIFLLNDQDPLVRALALKVMTTTLSQIQSFPPSDSKIFPQYIFKRVAPLLTDPSLVVRVAFSQCLAVLAETSRRFLDICHAVRLYESVGGGGTSTPIEKRSSGDTRVFADDVTKLLDGPKSEDEKNEARETTLATIGAAGHNILIANTYDSEISTLQEVVSRWILHITTSEQSSAPKRALLRDLARLCNFFDREGVMAFILPQILAFLNERRDWRLRAALFDDLPAACYVIGRAATEHFVLPCLETALVDIEDQVLLSALLCLAALVGQGLLSRSVLVDTRARSNSNGVGGNTSASKRGALLDKYCPLLLFPAANVRHGAIVFVNACCNAFGSPDADVFLVPILRPYLRFEPSQRHLTTIEGLEKCLVEPWTKEWLDAELLHLSPLNITGDGKKLPVDKGSELGEQVKDYLTMIARSRASRGRTTPDFQTGLQAEIEGSLKLSQNVKFPMQSAAATLDNPVPTWFGDARAIAGNGSGSASAPSSLQSVAALNQVYGLSIMRGSEETPDILPADTVISEDFDLTAEELEIRMRADDAKQVDAAFAGEWGSECVLDPALKTTTSLVGKLKSLDVPTLSPRLGLALDHGPTKDLLAKGMGDWRPKVETMIASSSPVEGHSGPVSRLAVSKDQRFFVSGSFDSTCRVWELGKIDNSSGIMNSSVTYNGHKDTESERPARINDIAVLEGSHSVASASSDGHVHVWRVDLVTSRISPQAPTPGQVQEHTRVSGSSAVRTIDSRSEGEILAVSHYNTLSESVVAFATQRGSVHTWDLRSEKEPFHLKHPAEVGYMTSMALGTDRNWIVTGSSKGFVALWDIRYQTMVKLWHHSGDQPITRLATSYAQIPGSRSNSGVRPLMFLSSGSECGMFDIMDGACRQGFRVLNPQPGYGMSQSRVELATLKEIHVGGKSLNSTLRQSGLTQKLKEQHAFPDGPQLNAMVGSMGGYDQNYLITGGGDAQIRYWDFSNPSKCYTVSGQYGSPIRPNYDRVDFPISSRLMICRQTSGLRLRDLEGSRVPRRLQRGLTRAESRHQDAILDLKLIQTPIKAIVSCSRDGTIKLFK